jgi:hypothetical protein
MTTIGPSLLLIAALLGLTVLPLAGHADTCPYTEDTAVFPNPERGWFVFRELKPVGENVNQWATEDLLDSYFAQGYRLAKHIVNIPTNRDPIPQDFIDRLQAEADLFRAKGFKVIYRFNYNWNHGISKDDAPLEVTLAHLDQLKPFFARNKDVLFAIEMGFIGYWGEMHSSTQGHIRPRQVAFSDSGKAIMQRIFEVVPSDRCISVRYPKNIYTDPVEYGSLGFVTPLDDTTAYSGSVQSRLGSWYSNFGAGDMLYHHQQELRAKWAPETRYVPQWAHCDHFDDVSMDPREWMEDAIEFHYRALSNPKDEEHTQDIYQAWMQTGVYDEFARRLGCRYRLLESNCADRVEGGSFQLQLTLHNDGWGRPVNPRILEVVLRSVDTGTTYAVPVMPPRDFRLWFPGAHEQTRIRAEVTLPPSLPRGRYEVLLNLPDPEASLRADPAYSIRLASLFEGRTIWEPTTGYNRLGHVVEVTREVGAAL